LLQWAAIGRLLLVAASKFTRILRQLTGFKQSLGSTYGVQQLSAKSRPLESKKTATAVATTLLPDCPVSPGSSSDLLI